MSDDPKNLQQQINQLIDLLDAAYQQIASNTERINELEQRLRDLEQRLEEQEYDEQPKLE